MNSGTSLRNALKAVRACRSFRGEDFERGYRGSRSSPGGFAKRFTNRRIRQLGKAIVHHDSVS